MTSRTKWHRRVAQLASCQTLVTLPYLDAGAAIPASETLTKFTEGHVPQPLHFEPMGFDDPLFIIFSSGTTGLPKCIIHRTGGVLLQHMKEQQLRCDIRLGDRLL